MSDVSMCALVQRDAFIAACKGFVPNLEQLLEKLSINVVDDVGASLLHWACFKRKVTIVKLLLERGTFIFHTLRIRIHLK